ncbi:MAG: hypothetical protein FJX90_05300 [Bacteroidetes bacterium]|nr:hypothetical protein [Bacteroidota bacterium]
MIRILLIVFLSATCFLIRGQKKIDSVQLKSKQNKNSISNSTNGNGFHSRQSDTLSVSSEIKQNVLSETNDIETSKLNLENQLARVQNIKSQLRADRDRYKKAKQNGTWKKICETEKMLKAQLKEVEL